MEHQTSIYKGLKKDLTKPNQKKKKEKENRFNFGINLKGFLYYLLSYKSYNMDAILKNAFIYLFFLDLYFGALWICHLVVSGPSL